MFRSLISLSFFPDQLLVRAIISAPNFNQMFAFYVNGRQSNLAGRRAGRGVLSSRSVTWPLTQTADLILVPGVGLLGVGLGVPQLVEFPGFLNERCTILFTLLPQRWRDSQVTRSIWERCDLWIDERKKFLKCTTNYCIMCIRDLDKIRSLI